MPENHSTRNRGSQKTGTVEQRGDAAKVKHGPSTASAGSHVSLVRDDTNVAQISCVARQEERMRCMPIHYKIKCSKLYWRQ